MGLIGTHLMVAGNQFRRILPLSQTALALFFGGWGLWIRDSILSQPFFWFNSVELHRAIFTSGRGRISPRWNTQPFILGELVRLNSRLPCLSGPGFCQEAQFSFRDSELGSATIQTDNKLCKCPYGLAMFFSPGKWMPISPPDLLWSTDAHDLQGITGPPRPNSEYFSRNRHQMED